MISALRAQSKITALQSVPNFQVNNYFIGSDGRSLIATDNSHQKICIIDDSNQFHVFNRNVLFRQEIAIVDENWTKRSISGVVTRFVLGKLLGGNVGALVGGLTTGTKTQQKIQTIHLNIVIEDFSSPFHQILFYQKGMFTNLRTSIERVNHWYYLLDIMKNNNRRRFFLVNE